MADDQHPSITSIRAWHAAIRRRRPARPIDPVCGMTVKIEGAKHTHRHGGGTYYFCSARLPREVHRRSGALPRRRCQGPRCGGRSQSRSRQARSTPAPCIPRSCRRARALARTAAWRSSPRACRRPTPAPIRNSSISRIACGSAPRSPSRSWSSPWGRTLACRCTAGLSPQAAGWIELVLATPVVLWCGWPFLERGWASIVNRSPNMWTLISIGVLVAYAYSLVAVLAPGLFPHDFHDARRDGRPLLRGRRRHRRAGACRPGARTEGARADRQRHPRPAQSRAEDRAPRGARRRGDRSAARRRPCRRPAARAPGRGRPRRRRRRRGPLGGR